MKSTPEPRRIVADFRGVPLPESPKYNECICGGELRLLTEKPKRFPYPQSMWHNQRWVGCSRCGMFTSERNALRRAAGTGLERLN
jgi:hypothetical protein